MRDPIDIGRLEKPGRGWLTGDGTGLRKGVLALLVILLMVILVGAARLAGSVGAWIVAEWPRGLASEPAKPLPPGPVVPAARLEPGRPDPIPPELKRLPKARPINSPGTWIGSDDYPAAALRGEIEGSVGVALLVREDGALDQCFVQESSGARVLDVRTCELITERAHFAPAVDAEGQSVRSQTSLKFTWKIAE